MTKNSKIILILSLFICALLTGIVVLVVAIIINFYNPLPPQGYACTAEAKLCADGSGVGRSGPKCEFELCPEERSKAGQTTPNCCSTREKDLGYKCVVDEIQADLPGITTYSCLSLSEQFLKDGQDGGL